MSTEEIIEIKGIFEDLKKKDLKLFYLLRNVLKDLNKKSEAS